MILLSSVHMLSQMIICGGGWCWAFFPNVFMFNSILGFSLPMVPTSLIVNAAGVSRREAVSCGGHDCSQSKEMRCGLGMSTPESSMHVF